MEKPLVCIVIVNYNGGKVTLDCLNSLFDITSYPNYKVIVIDNASTDNSKDNLYSFKKDKIDVIEMDNNIGYAPAINVGWRYCITKYNPDYICNMNNDIVTIQKVWLDLMVDVLESDIEYGICGNKLIWPDGRVQLLFAERDHNDFEDRDNGQYDFIRETSGVGGANILIKRKVIDVVGGLDEHYFYGADDLDYCKRTISNHYKIIYNGFSKSQHLGSFSYLSSKKDFIYKHQSYAQILFHFRWNGFLGGLKMIFRQFFRAFITRKRPYERQSLNNTYFHWSFPKRIIYFLRSVFLAILNYDYVDNRIFNGNKNKIKSDLLDWLMVDDI